jgi:carboxypeptidase T
MKHLLFIFLLLCLLTASLTAGSRVLIRIHTTDRGAAIRLSDEDIASVNPGNWVDLIVTPERLALLRSEGYNAEILQTEDQARLQTQRDLDGYRSYDDMVGELQMLADAFPDIIRLYTIGQSWGTTYSDQGNTNYTPHDIIAVKVSDEPDIEEDEPCVYYFGAHHAREPISLEVCMQVLYHYIEGWQNDPTITADIQNKQLWFVPLVNPDGHQRVFEEQDVWWRKNVRDNNNNGDFDTDHDGSGQDGVDLNRNYGYTWGDVGASNDYDSETYHGPNEFSEPETQAIRDLIETHHFVAGIGYHSYGEEVLTPYGNSNGIVAPDDTALMNLGDDMAVHISGLEGGHYTNSYSWALYPTSGGLDDWSYGANGVFAYTIEVATQFIPEANDVQTVADDNVAAAMILAHRLDHACLTGHVAESGDDANHLEATVFVRGVDDTGSPREPYKADAAYGRYYRLLEPGQYQVVFSYPGFLTQEHTVTISADSVTTLDLEMFEVPLASDVHCDVTDCDGNPLSNYDVYLNDPTDGCFTVTGTDGFDIDACSYGAQAIRIVKGDYGMIDRTFNHTTPQNSFVFRMDHAVFTDDFETGTSNWTLAGPWGLSTSNPHDGQNSLADSPNGDYGNDHTYYCTLQMHFDLSNAQSASAGYYIRHSLEEGYDYLAFQGRAGSGDWVTLNNFTAEQSQWIYATAPLTPFCGQEDVSLRFVFCSDEGVTGDGAYIDDFGVFSDDYAMPYTYGDLNGDGSVTTEDATLILAQSAATGAWVWQTADYLAADVDASGEVNSYDAALVQRFATSAIDVFPAELGGFEPPAGQITVNHVGDSLRFTFTGEVYAANLISLPGSGFAYGDPLILNAPESMLMQSSNDDGFRLALSSPVLISGVRVNISYNPNLFGDHPMFVSVNGVSSVVTLTHYGVGVEDQVAAPTSLLGNWPNPFNPETRIAYNLANSGEVSLEIYNLRGQKIRSLVAETQSQGKHEAVWNGRDDSGRPAPSGVYCYRFRADGKCLVRKMLMLK